MQSKFIFKPFTKKDYPAYKAWFSNLAIKRALGDIDEEWLEYVLNDKEGIEFTVRQDQQLIAVIGLTLPNQENKACVITNIAVHPDLTKKGIGTMVLSQLVQAFKLEKDQYWSSYVEKWNEPAQRFFEKNGWKRKEIIDDDEMIRFEKKQNQLL